MVAQRILIIEDEALVAEMMAFSLEDAGYEVVGIFDSEAEAIERSATEQPDLLLVDINLGPSGDGVRAVEAIAARRPVPVLFVTAQTDAATAARARAAAAAAFLFKPFTAPALVEAVAAALRAPVGAQQRP